MERNDKIKVLIVDDSSTNIVLLEAILEEEGYLIFKAQNASEAKKIVTLESISVILLDILMPHISGFEFLADLKGNTTTKDISVIIISAVNDTETVNKAYELGAVDFLEKPININDVIEKVESNLNLDSRMY